MRHPLLYCLVILLSQSALAIAASPSKAGTNGSYEKTQSKAIGLYARDRYKEAAVFFRKALGALAGNKNPALEVETRKYLVLALFNSNQRDSSIQEFRALRALAPTFAFDADEVLPETIAYFNAVVPQVLAAPVTTPTEQDKPVAAIDPARPSETKPELTQIDAAPSEAPREIKPAETATDITQKTSKQPWRWYYLTPLGIGQYLAGSPVRGTIILVVQAAFIAMNIAGNILYNRELIYGDGTARDPAAALRGQTVMNVGFFGIIGSALLGTIDGAFLEP